MKIRVIHGRTGGGKSTLMKAEIIKPGLYLLVVPRRSSVDECADDLRKLKRERDTSIKITSFKTAEGKRTKTKITKQISDACAKYETGDHVCLIITQAAFLMLDMTLFRGWHLRHLCEFGCGPDESMS